jgi:hypothetical protein
LNVNEIYVNPDWKYNEEDFGNDISLIKFEDPLNLTKDFRPINLPPQIQENEWISSASNVINELNTEILHTINGIHSFNIPFTRISTTECILRDYTINKYLGENQYCASQLENQYCVNGYGEQLYDYNKNTLYGLVSVGHRTHDDCVNNNSLVITELRNHSESIRNAICGDVR